MAVAATEALLDGSSEVTMDRVRRMEAIQGVLALDNSFNRVGLDHVLLVRIATTAVVTVSATSRRWPCGT